MRKTSVLKKLVQIREKVLWCEFEKTDIRFPLIKMRLIKIRLKVT